VLHALPIIPTNSLQAPPSESFPTHCAADHHDCSTDEKFRVASLLHQKDTSPEWNSARKFSSSGHETSRPTKSRPVGGDDFRFRPKNCEMRRI
jgi:hypothetical protein